MKKTIAGTLLSVSALAGLAACSVPEEGPFSKDRETATEETAPEEVTPPGPTTLQVGDTHEVTLDDYGDSYTVTVNDVRYMESITATEYEPSGEFVTAFDGEGYFAVIDLTYTNTEQGQQEFAQVFNSYADLSGNVVANDESSYTPADPSGYNIFNAGDVGAEALLLDIAIPAGASVEASEVVTVPEKSGYLYSFDGEFRLELPEE